MEKSDGGDDDEDSNGSEGHIVDHTYHDYSNVENNGPHHQDDYVPTDLNEVASTQSFPLKLHDLLTIAESSEHADVHDIISWQPHGRSFVVHQKETFVAQILPRCFKQSQYASFQRQLNLYGFRRLTAGPDSGGYYHELMLRGKRFLCHHILRTKIKNQGTRKKNSPETEPRFYDMTFVPPKDKKRAARRIVAERQQQPVASVMPTTSTSSAVAAARAWAPGPPSSTFPGSLAVAPSASGAIWSQQLDPTPSFLDFNTQLHNVPPYNAPTNLSPGSMNTPAQYTAHWPTQAAQLPPFQLDNQEEGGADAFSMGYLFGGPVSDGNNVATAARQAALDPSQISTGVSHSQAFLSRDNPSIGHSLLPFAMRNSPDFESIALAPLNFAHNSHTASAESTQVAPPFSQGLGFGGFRPMQQEADGLMPLQLPHNYPNLIQGQAVAQDQFIGSTMPTREVTAPNPEPPNDDSAPNTATLSHRFSGTPWSSSSNC